MLDTDRYRAVLLDDSIPTGDDPVGQTRLTTFQITFPRIVLAEFNTHRMFARNAASSRAIPTKVLLDDVAKRPYIPDPFGKNQRGMQANGPLDAAVTEKAYLAYMRARRSALGAARELAALGVHKEDVNRLLEPWLWTTVVVTGTTAAYANFFHLRCDAQAHPAIRRIALKMRDAYRAATPRSLAMGAWHTPYATTLPSTVSDADRVRVSVGRCARVSVLGHDGEIDAARDIALHDRLMAAGHWSPFEHQATPVAGHRPDLDAAGARTGPVWGVAGAQNRADLGGNLGHGWVQYRKTCPGEYVTTLGGADGG